ncbi:ArnT family glycosyltransferase [Paucidesulfovibrio longus]|uniref:ArnT family glycosyltransferase n=1 Tax=Paucidesulfovibrio longus TaxID=889 RepID=UPI0003B4D87A|nr:glycosyltransferase family 39 protein [Paucidesulfovibrio longus]
MHSLTHSMTRSLNERPGLWAFLIILTTFAVRVAYVASGQVTLVQDEAQYWDWTRHLQLTYYSKGPLIAWIIHLWTSVFGDTELGVRFGSIFGSVLTQAVLYLGIAKLWKQPRVALWTLFIYNTTVIFSGLSILMTTDNPFTLTWTCCLFLLYLGSRPLRGERAPWWPFALLSVAFGIGVLAKYTMLGFIGLAGLYWLILLRQKACPKGFFAKLATALGVGLFLGFLPTLIWNMQNDFVGYKHVLHLIGAQGKEARHLFDLQRVPEHLLAQIGLALPWWLFFMFVGSGRALRLAFRRRPPEDRAEIEERKRAALLMVLFLPVWLFFFFWSFHAKIMPNWTTVSYVAGCILAARAVDRALQKRDGFLQRHRKLLPALGIGLFLLMHTAQLLPLPSSIDPTRRVKGWRELGQVIEEHRLHDFADPDKVFIFSNLYDMTAALAFYTPGQPRTYCGWVDSRRMNQYDLWPGPDADKVGWDAVYVLKGYDDLPANEVQKMFDSFSDPIYVQTTFNGREARRFTLFLCKGYNGYWPKRHNQKF